MRRCPCPYFRAHFSMAEALIADECQMIMHPQSQLILTQSTKHLFHRYCADQGVMFVNGRFYERHSPNVWVRECYGSVHLERFRHHFSDQYRNGMVATLSLTDISELLASAPSTFDHVPAEYTDCHICSTTTKSVVTKSCPKRTWPYSDENILTDALVSGVCICVGNVLFFKAIQGLGYGTYGLSMHGLSSDIVTIAMALPTCFDRKHGYMKVPKPFFSQVALNGTQELVSWMHRALQGEVTSMCISICHERHCFNVTQHAVEEGVESGTHVETALQFLIEPINDAISSYTGAPGQLKLKSFDCQRYYIRYLKDYTLLCHIWSIFLTYPRSRGLERRY